MTKITLQRDILRAVSRFMAKEDIRYYLNGVKVEVHRAVAYLVATDGHRLAVARVEGSPADPWEPCEAIIPGDALAVVLKSGSAAIKKLAVILTLDGDSFEFNACGAITAGKLIDGKFPDWRKVIPAKVSGERAHFNTEYLMECHKARADLGSKFSPAIGHNGEAPAIFELREDVLAVLMPMRGHDSPEVSPDWIREDSANVGRVMDPDAAHVEALAEYAARELSGDDSEPGPMPAGFRFEHLTTGVRLAA